MRALLVEDDPRIAEPLLAALEEAGHRLQWACDGHAGLMAARAGGFDVIILDVMLPGLDGFSVARTLRHEGSTTPILFLTARSGLDDRVAGLDLGGDAYLVKPFALPELQATLRALLRRDGPQATNETPFAGGRGLLDSRSRRVTFDDDEVALTGREYELLESLLRAPGKWFQREELLDRVWGPDFYGEPRIVDVYVRYLRKKLSDGCIESARGRGYRAT